ncbi:Pbp4p [Saccharomyces eubayanus]|uniref:Pbp4p n=1 Tax=Saccharomyces eubayanus TaxID=1080349 RepID=UPI0006C70328|nr:PBP4-like protein [Saccharomyces eubayanus]KOH00308.1 PBP4-like protein [Saccharomyces eubayanus]
MKMTTTSTTNVNGKATPALKTTLSTSNSNSNSPPTALPQKPKLTGWAQAAAKALPKQQQQQQPRRDDSSSPQPGNGKTKATVSTTPSTNTKGSSSVNGSSTNKKFKRANKQPYNRDEVRSYMHKLFQDYTTGEMSHSVKTYKQVLSETASGRVSTATDWGTVSNSKNKNKKYGCLTDIAKILKN